MRDSPVCFLCHLLVRSLKLEDLHQFHQLDCRTDINRKSLFSSFSTPTSDNMKRYALGQTLAFNNPPTLYKYKLGRRETCVLVNALRMRKVDYVTQVST